MLYKKFLVILGILILLVITFHRPIRGLILKMVVDGIYKNSSVTTIEPDLVNESKGAVILDTRSKEEYEVSHIENAQWVGYNEFDLGALNDIPRDTPVIVYCSIGYRSQMIGEKLMDSAGFTNVQNLYGGIFNWVNKGLPVYQAEKMTDSIHTYSRKWSFFVYKGRKVY